MALKFGCHHLRSVFKPVLNIRRYCIVYSDKTGEISDESNKFGTYELNLDERMAYNKFDFVPDDMDSQDKYEAMVGDIYRPGREQYLRRINYLVHEKNDLRGALNTLEKDMKDHCVKPEQPHFRILIHACAKVGHTKKAFDLYKEFQDRGLPRHVGIFTDLFLSCSNSNDKVDALKHATTLRKRLAEKHFIPNKILYHSMIQAFGRCGDLETAFELIDEMRINKVPVTSETFSFLLQGCVSDKQHGFRHALLTWRAMRRKKIWPKIYTYNLMLKAAHDCGLGDIKHTADIVQACRTREQQLSFESSWTDRSINTMKKTNENIIDNYEEKLESSSVQIVSREEKSALAVNVEPPNILAKRPDVTNIVGLAPKDTASNRLMLMGGPIGFVDWMVKDRVKPDIKTIDQMLSVIPNTQKAEGEVLSLLDKLKIEPDVTFFNKLIILREQRGDLKHALSTLQLMSEKEICPDIMTFGCLARCCKDYNSVKSFINDMDKMDVRMNKEILTTLLGNMCIALQPSAVLRLLKVGVKHHIKPDKKMINTVERFYQTFRNFIILNEKGKKVPRMVLIEIEKHELNNWRRFVSYYNKTWLVTVVPDFNKNPNKQYYTEKDKIKGQIRGS